MSAQRANPPSVADDHEILDPETSAAIIRWMDTAHVPDGIMVADWERWVEGGCRDRLEANGVSVTPSMLGRWAQSGELR
jgi:poly(3-hydroxyalkanoate) synthetase